MEEGPHTYHGPEAPLSVTLTTYSNIEEWPQACSSDLSPCVG